MIRVLLCDDHAMIRRGIRETLSEAVDVQVCGEASNYAEVKALLRNAACDVLILDLNLPGRSGLEVLETVREAYPHVRVLIVSMYEADQYALRCLRAGAHGYLNKAGDPTQIVQAVRTLGAGRKFLTPEVSDMLVNSLAQPVDQAPHEQLSEREMQTLLKIASGKKLSEIADDLMLSPKTVSVYRARLLEKLKLSSNAELAVYANRNNLI
ncbi:response regulator transcription factor [Curvibacter sp. APW13]|uniref:response regulator transcription factor n=1 Tax=Curvibacter sp. APW13 TaxID=3077236 RepID=UPI0028DD5B94|nr:response regulator transcription factor [Curvibacter sp. APW13]MDT8992915.1 response regulator transcription factor [Curvibacter sp. APW13]